MADTDSTQLSLPPLFWELHAGLGQQAPGSNEATLHALDFTVEHVLTVKPNLQALTCLVIGCGPGREVLVIANHPAFAERGGSKIIATDTSEVLLNELRHRITRAQLPASLVEVRNVSMTMLCNEFHAQEFSILWSEGSAYVIGIEKALQEWKPLLTVDAGVLALTECCWLVEDKKEVPSECFDFWEKEYPGMKTIKEVKLLAGDMGYKLLRYFTLDKECWENYYQPIRFRLQKLKEKYKNDDSALQTIHTEEHEVNIYDKYSTYYGYVFFLLQRIA